MIYPPVVVMELIEQHGRRLRAEAEAWRIARIAAPPARRIRRAVGRRLVALGRRIELGVASCCPADLEGAST